MSSDGNEKYYVGIDIGTDSVGWAVTDHQYHILRRKGKALWGIRLFEEAKTAENRRFNRTNRRRLQRRKQRIRLLQEMFAEEIGKVDPKFFQRLEDSAFWLEDKQEQQIYSLFAGEMYTDVDYYKEYPTIYHLRSALLREKGPFDVRLVYLAIHHLMKHRGHFLFSGVSDAASFDTTFQKFRDSLAEEFGIELTCDSKESFAEILKDKKMSRSKKCAGLTALCHVGKEDRQLKEILKLITGMKGSLSVVFEEEELKEIEHDKISFSESSYEEVRLDLEDEIQERTEILDVFHAVYSWAILADILDGGEYEGKAYLSVAKVHTYEKHREDLQKLKKLVRKYCPQEYASCFSTDQEKNNYCAYIGSCRKNGRKKQVKKCTQDDFLKFLKKLISKMPSGDLEVEEMKEEVENGVFLPLQVNRDNGVIPYQVNKMELERILEHAEMYLPFLKQVDAECGKSIREKIIELFEFRIPYYVGPLNTAKGENCWMCRKEPGAVRPWNFDRKVDRDRSAEAFIMRMTNPCTYLEHEKVLPKNSLLYSEYMVLNELNNVRIRNEKLPVELKQDIFKNLFKREKRVTGKRLLEYLNTNGYDLKRDEISGFDGDFKASLTSYRVMKNIFQEELEKYSVQQMAEDIILWITLYGEDQKMLRRVIRKHYGENLTEEQIQALSRLKFQGWGRLSRRFLDEIEGMDRSTGECMTIMQGLRSTQNNLMQMLSQKYTFIETIEEENGGYHIEEITYDHLVKDIVASPSIKRAVWQTVQILEEIKGVMGCEPEKIFIEMARGPEEKKRTVSRKDKLLEIYEAIKEEAPGWKEELEKYSEGDFKAIKLYLYYTQMGRCMYTGKRIDLSQLNQADIWDRDHIYPQSKTKDDSLDNLVLVDRTANARKSDGMISSEIQQKMESTWRSLRDKGLISDKKYERLTRTTPLTEEELAGFIGRQLVETRQSSKVVATLLKRIYEEAEIVYVKAKAVADFRQKKLEYVKVRDLNDYHHAKDAYLNIVVGNVYHTKFTGNPLQWLKNHPDHKYSLDKMFDYDLCAGGEDVWKKGTNGSLHMVNETLKRNDILFTRYAFCAKGELFNQTLVKAAENSERAKILVPIKKGMDTKKYGGYTSVQPSHFMLVESEDKKGKKIRTIEAVPLYLNKKFEKEPEALLRYCEEFYGLKNPKIILPCIKTSARVVLDGFPMHLKGTTGKQLFLQGAVQLCLDSKRSAYLKKVTKYLEENAQRKDKKGLLEVREITGISQDSNLDIYDVFIEKLSSTIYQYRPANPREDLKKKRGIFGRLSLAEQCVVLGEILKLFQCKPVTADLKLIGASANTGKVQKNKAISKCDSAKLVSQSVTGLYERTIDLLSI